ncbi:nucleotidyltransferase family protein [Exiguobacterium sp. s59]|uniref:nucleotidyltransferase family protein n=1 Tax=Exiguobacterium sp. s59 TaxID=2751269 RepID=UPI001BEB1405|nr:nucleotidyltransferase family protein [Exiguobacterium sp. s59]
MEHEQDLIHFLQQDAELMKHLRTVATLHLPDWWICAGYIRAKIWDHLHGYDTPTQTDDVDVIYFDPTQPEESIEKEIEQTLYQLNPNVPWSVKNQARMHHVNHLPPYTSSMDALAHFPETVTAIGVRLNSNGDFIFAAPYGIQDLLSLQVKPTPLFEANSSKHSIYLKRMAQKNWPAQWPNVKLYT